jgi:hypothetical protein
MHVGVERRLGFLVVLRRQAASLAISNEWADLPCPMGLLSDTRPRPKFIGWALYWTSDGLGLIELPSDPRSTSSGLIPMIFTILIFFELFEWIKSEWGGSIKYTSRVPVAMTEKKEMQQYHTCQCATWQPFLVLRIGLWWDHMLFFFFLEKIFCSLASFTWV